MSDGGLTITGLTVDHGGVRAVDRVTLRVPSGTIAGLVGPNGAGKTSLIDACCGLVPAEGSVTVDGHDLGSLGHAGRARLGLARTFQRAALFDSLTVAENVGVGWEGVVAGRHPGRHLVERPRDRGRRRRAVDDALERCGIATLAPRPAAQLTTGQRRLVGLARALVGGFRVLLLDEPGAGLDADEKCQLAAVVASAVVDAHGAVLLVEHDRQLVESLCSHLFEVVGGVLVFDGPPKGSPGADVGRAPAPGGGLP